MSIILALATLTAMPAVRDTASPDADVPVRVWISSNRTFKPGETVRVQVETERSGHLLVLHYDPDGRLTVLFPISPDDETLVDAGRRYEIRGQESAASFVAEGGGPGLVYAALADDPWSFGSAAAGGAWDYSVLGVPRDSEDPEKDITELLQRLVSTRGFDYDALDYAVLGHRGDRVGRPSWWSPTYDLYYDDDYGYDCYSCSNYGPTSIYLGFGWPYGYPGWNWWSYSPYRYYYGYGRPWYWGYNYPYYPHYGGGVVVRRPYGVISGRPRGYTLERWTRGATGRTGFDRAPANRNDGGAVAPRGPARRARGDRPTTGRTWNRDESGRGTVNRPSNGGGTRSGDGASRPSNGDDRGSARPRGNDRGSRPRGGRNEVQAEARPVGPAIERSRPESRTRGPWIRVDDQVTSRGEARRVEPRGEPRSMPVRIETPPARRAEPSDRARGASIERRAEPRGEPRRSQPADRAPAVSRGGGERSAPPARATAPSSHRSGGEARSGGNNSSGSNRAAGGGRARGGRP